MAGQRSYRGTGPYSALLGAQEGWDTCRLLPGCRQPPQEGSDERLQGCRGNMDRVAGHGGAQPRVEPRGDRPSRGELAHGLQRHGDREASSERVGQHGRRVVLETDQDSRSRRWGRRLIRLSFRHSNQGHAHPCDLHLFRQTREHHSPRRLGPRMDPANGVTERQSSLFRQAPATIRRVLTHGPSHPPYQFRAA